MTRKVILLADDDKDFLKMMIARCEHIGFDVIYAQDAMTALSSANISIPDVICIDVNMPKGNGLSVCEMVAANEKLRSVPMIVLTGSDSPDIKQRCQSLSAHYVQKSGQIWSRLEPLLKSLMSLDSDPAETDQSDMDELDTLTKQTNSIDELLEALESEEFAEDANEFSPDAPANPTVLLIDDDPDWAFALKTRLAKQDITVVSAMEGMEGFRCAFSNQIQAIILDFEMGDVQGDYVLGRLKDNPITESIPVIVVTGHNQNSLKRKVINQGASAFLTKPVAWAALWDELQKHVDVPAGAIG